MEKSLGSAIEKIKREEQNKEAKLKAKRELESTKAATERSIRDVTSQIKKFHQESVELLKNTDELNSQLIIQKIRRDALAEQLAASMKAMAELKSKMNQATIGVQELLSNYCESVQNISDECDVWALLTKPSTEPVHSRPLKKHAESNENLSINENKLKNAKERLEKAIAERDRLKSEPETGEEFKRSSLQPNKPRRLFSSRTNKLNKDEVIENENEPIKFSTSSAAQTKTIKPVMKKVKIESPWYQPFSVVGSVAVFLIYFCIFREENDVDAEFSRTLYDRIKGLEKQQLLQSYRFNKENGKSVAEIEARLKELDEQERAEKATAYL